MFKRDCKAEQNEETVNKYIMFILNPRFVLSMIFIATAIIILFNGSF